MNKNGSRLIIPAEMLQEMNGYPHVLSSGYSSHRCSRFQFVMWWNVPQWGKLSESAKAVMKFDLEGWFPSQADAEDVGMCVAKTQSHVLFASCIYIYIFGKPNNGIYRFWEIPDMLSGSFRCFEILWYSSHFLFFLLRWCTVSWRFDCYLLMQFKWPSSHSFDLPSGYVKIAIENGYL